MTGNIIIYLTSVSFHLQLPLENCAGMVVYTSGSWSFQSPDHSQPYLGYSKDVLAEN